MTGSLNAHAQLTSVDNGAAAIDNNGLMWANTVGIDLGGQIRAWLLVPRRPGLQASTPATTAGTTTGCWRPAMAAFSANSITNQLGELFYTDCGNSAGTSTVLNLAGKSCTSLSALNSIISTPSIFFSSSIDTAASGGSETVFWVYKTPDSANKAGPATQFSAVAAFHSLASVMPWRSARHPRSTRPLPAAASLRCSARHPAGSARQILSARQRLRLNRQFFGRPK